LQQEVKDKDYVIVGRLLGTHGVKGDLRVEIYPPKLKLPKQIFIKDKEGNIKPINIERYSKTKRLVQLEGINNKEDAKKFTNTYIYLPKEKLPKLEKEQFYEYQLLGMDVEYKGKIIGKIEKIDDRLSHAYLLIKCIDDKIRHLPFISEFVKEVDLKNNKIIVELPEGWFNL